VANGDLSKKITVAVEGEILELKSTINTMVDQLRTCPVRLAAIMFTLSVRSFQVPPTPRTCAWPPSLPSMLCPRRSPST
jgi:hypothetical protein